MHTKSIDLNCDMGESFGAYKMGNDEEILHFVTSANIACGFHAGDPSVMKKTVKLALEANVAIGAHPGFPDLAGFGRRDMVVSAEEVFNLVVYQIGALWAFVQAEGGLLHHVKPHGALYNKAAVNYPLAEAIAKAVYQVNPEWILYGLAGSELIRAGEKMGLQTANEVFADRTYRQDGTLTPRKSAHALITSHTQAVNQALHMVQEGKVLSVTGEDVAIEADTLCIHGDGPHALIFARDIYEAFANNGISMQTIRGKRQ